MSDLYRVTSGCLWLLVRGVETAFSIPNSTCTERKNQRYGIFLNLYTNLEAADDSEDVELVPFHYYFPYVPDQSSFHIFPSGTRVSVGQLCTLELSPALVSVGKPIVGSS